jgi:SAM-dependent MidA family methyltransferase
MAAPTRLPPPVTSTTGRFSLFVIAEHKTEMATAVDTHFAAPTPEARAHAAQVAAHIRELIASARVPASAQCSSISFADFMRAALYAPGLGYYAAGATKLGAGGDFTTAPEMSPLFGAALADLLLPCVRGEVLELGAGSGKLAHDFLSARSDPPRYSILDISADLRERQRTALQGKDVCWLDALPASIHGIVIANEVLDAIPCEMVRFNEERYEQARIVFDDDGFKWLWQALPEGALLDAARQRIPAIEGYTSEINLEAEALVATLAARTDDGVLCLVDYGFARREYYVSDRRGGTLACHYQHRVHFDPLRFAGLQDITAHVDFTAMAEAAVDAGASVICFASQAQFLLHAGLLKRFERTVFANEIERVKALGAIQKLLSPTEMGELFKVLVIGKGSAVDALAHLADIDQSYRL